MGEHIGKIIPIRTKRDVTPSSVVTTSLAEFAGKISAVGSGKLIGELVEIQTLDGFGSFITISLEDTATQSILYQEAIDTGQKVPYALTHATEDRRLLRDYYTLIHRVKEIATATRLPSLDSPERQGEWHIRGVREIRFGDKDGTLYVGQDLDPEQDTFVDFFALRRTVYRNGLRAIPMPEE